MEIKTIHALKNFIEFLEKEIGWERIPKEIDVRILNLIKKMEKVESDLKKSRASNLPPRYY